MNAFITKYALTKGVQEVNDAELCSETTSMIHVKSLGMWGYFHKEGRDWHRTREAACVHAEQMRRNKIASLKKSLTKLEALTF
jgi:hypothetical protein